MMSVQLLKFTVFVGRVNYFADITLILESNTMKHKKLLYILLILVALGVISFLLYVPIVLRDIATVGTQQSEVREITEGPKVRQNKKVLNTDPWESWLDEQTDIQIEVLLEAIGNQMPHDLEGAQSEVETLMAQMRETFERLAKQLKENSDIPPPVRAYDFSELPPPENQQVYDGPQKHNGPQTVEALLASFEEMIVNPAIDDRYPQAEWLQMLLDKGIIIEDYGDYSGYMISRWGLARREHQPEEWASGNLGIPPTNDWETYKAAYIDRKIWEYQQLKAAMESNPEVSGGTFIGPNQGTFIPFIPGRVYVDRSQGGGSFIGKPLSDEQKFDILFRGKHPAGYDIIYINEDGDTLTEIPSPITREEISSPADNRKPQPVKDNFAQQLPSENLEYVPTQRSVQTDKDRFNQAQIEKEILRLATLSDTEFEAEIQRLLRPEPPTAEDVGETLHKRFSPEYLQKTFTTLNKYGLEEGLRRLEADDIEMIEQLERLMRRKRPAQRSNRKN